MRLTTLACCLAALSLSFAHQLGPSKRQAADKLVVAHQLVGNTFPYQVSDWANDISVASAAGIDGFALNVGSDDWQPARVADAYTAASQSGTSFKLFLSFDMAVNPCFAAENATILRTYITNYTDHPNQLKMGDRVFASTFAGQTCQFGQDSVADGWNSQFLQHPDIAGTVFFVPSFFVDDSAPDFSQFASVIDGDFNWNGGWPITLTADQVNSFPADTKEQQLQAIIGSTDVDQRHIDALAKLPADSNGEARIFMAAMSPWFFTHYGPPLNKNFIYDADEHLVVRRWQNLMNIRDEVAMVEIVTWNDYGESHYVGPIDGAQPDGTTWVNGFDHTGWLPLIKYYATFFKTGQAPAIEKDQLVLWARPHPANATATNDPLPPPDNAAMDLDKMWAIALATAAGTATLNGQSFPINAGVNNLSVPLAPGDGMNGTIVRDGQTVVTLQAEGFTFEAQPQTYNFNALVVASPS